MKYIIPLLIFLLNTISSIAQLIQSEDRNHSTIFPMNSTFLNPNQQNNPLMITEAFQNQNKGPLEIQYPLDGRILASISPEIAHILAFINVETDTLAISPDGKILLLFDPITRSYQVFDISKPSSPVNVSSIPVNVSSVPLNIKGFGAAAAFSSDSKTAFVTNVYDYENDDIGTLLVINLSNISTPIIMASYVIPQSDTLTLSPDDKALFLSTPGFGVTILDVSNHTSPMNISVINNTLNPIDMALSADGTRLFVIDNSSLYVFDVSNPRSSQYLNKTALINSIALGISPDGNNAFVVTTDDPYCTLHVIDVSDSVSIKNISSIDLGFFLFLEFFEIAVFPDGNTLLITASDTLIMVNLLNITNPTSQTMDNLQRIYSVTLSPDGRYAFLSNQIQVIITELFLNVQVGKVFGLKPDIIYQNSSTGNPTDEFNQMAVSTDTKTVFMFGTQNIEILNTSNPTIPGFVSTYNFAPYECYAITIHPDEKSVFLTCDSELLVLNVSNLTSPNLITTIPAGGEYNNCKFEISPDGQLGFLPIDSGLGILNMSNLSSPVIIGAYNFSQDLRLDSLIVSKDSRTIFMALNEFNGNVSLEIVDVHIPTVPVKVSSTNITGETQDWVSIDLSPNEDYVIMAFSNIIIFNVSNRTAPTQVFWPELIVNNLQAVAFSADETILYAKAQDGLLIIDISVITIPRILRLFSFQQMDLIGMLALSPDGSTLFCGTPLTIIDLRPEYTPYMTQNRFSLGDISSSSLLPLQLNPFGEFDLISQNFSFLQVSLYSITSSPVPQITYPALPNWIVFDQDQGAFTFAPKDASQIGQYQIYAAISTQVPKDAFVNIISTITNETESIDLIASLIWTGYLDPKRFLTSNFNPQEELFLESQYAPYASKIQTKLSEYYIEMATSVSIESSLSVQFSDKISVTTLSQNTLSVIIKTSGTVQFAKSNYAALTTISSDQATITMQGSQLDINTALTQILINIDDSTVSYDGIVTISDSLNPQVNLPVDDMSNYFQIFKSPTLNSNFSIQSQVDQTPIFTGQQFMIDLNGMFSDPNGQDLDYSLAMQDGTQQVPEWLMLRGNAITGTPPEQLTQNDLKLIITASNQFKSMSQTFTINIKISLLYSLKLVATYGGALITAIGLWIYIYTFYNILCKRRYRYPRDFAIRVGDKKSFESICAIAFISEEVKASEIILNRIKMSIAKELKRKSITDSELVKYFIDPDSRKLDEDCIIKCIKHELIKTQTGEENLPFKGHLRPELVNQVIINQLIRNQLNLQDEKMTKKLFNAIKDDWINLVEEDQSDSDSLSFQLSRDKLSKRLQRLGVYAYKLSIDSDVLGSESLLNASKRSPISLLTSNMERELNKIEDSFSKNTQSNPLEGDILVPKRSSREASLLNHTQKISSKTKALGINFDLLEKAIIAHVFAYHHLNASRDDIEVIVNKKVPSGILPNSIRKFIKRDLYKIKFVGGSDTLYGIKFAIQEDVLRLSGTPEAVLKNKTLVVQIVNRRGKILRELWLNCFVSGLEEEQELKKVSS